MTTIAKVEKKEKECIAFSRRKNHGQFHKDTNPHNWDVSAGMIFFEVGDEVGFVAGDKSLKRGKITKLGWLQGPGRAYPGVEVDVKGMKYEVAPVCLVNFSKEKVIITDYAEQNDPQNVKRIPKSGIFFEAHLAGVSREEKAIMWRRDVSGLYVVQPIKHLGWEVDLKEERLNKNFNIATILHMEYEKPGPKVFKDLK